MSFPVSRLFRSHCVHRSSISSAIASSANFSKLSPPTLRGYTSCSQPLASCRTTRTEESLWLHRGQLSSALGKAQWARRAYASQRSHEHQKTPPSATPPPSSTPSPFEATSPPKAPLSSNLRTLASHENIYNIPNFLTLTRLIAAPLCGYLILHSQHTLAASLFLYAGLTDLLDGYLARKYALRTVVGSVIDPMADKTLMTILVATLAYTSSLPVPLAIVILGRDVSLAVAALYYRYASLPAPKTMRRYWDFSLPSAEVHPTTVSKYNTFLQLVLIGWTLVLPVIPALPPDFLSTLLAPLATALQGIGLPVSGSESWQPLTRTLQVLVAGTTLWSGLSYAVLKNAVTILGKDEALKKKQGRRGRAIIGVTYLAFVGVAAWYWVRREKPKLEVEAEEGKGIGEGKGKEIEERNR